MHYYCIFRIVKEIIALEDDYRASTESWAVLLRDTSTALSRGSETVHILTPTLATADRALGFWAALREVFPQTQEQRCRVHKIANVLYKLPTRLQSRTMSQLREDHACP